MLPVLEGTIARRVLLNFRADARVVQSLLPKPFVPETHQGQAIVGICLIRLEHLRPRGLPAKMGFSSENMAHRAAVRYPAGKVSYGVIIPVPLRAQYDALYLSYDVYFPANFTGGLQYSSSRSYFYCYIIYCYF